MTKVCCRRVTTVSVKFFPRQRKVHSSNPQAIAIMPTPVHLNQVGRDTEDQTIQSGSIAQAISPSQRAMPTGRNVAKMNGPSCHRSRLLHVPCELSLW